MAGWPYKYETGLYFVFSRVLIKAFSLFMNRNNGVYI